MYATNTANALLIPFEPLITTGDRWPAGCLLKNL